MTLGNALPSQELSHHVFLPLIIRGYDLPPDMALIPPGSLLMGCDSEHNGGFGCYNSERPLHTVHLDAFAIDKYEVTNDMVVNSGFYAVEGGMEAGTV